MSARERWRFVGRIVPEGIDPSIDGRECYRWNCPENYGRDGSVIFVKAVSEFWP